MGEKYHIRWTAGFLALLVVRLLGSLLCSPGKTRNLRSQQWSQSLSWLRICQFRLQCQWHAAPWTPWGTHDSGWTTGRATLMYGTRRASYDSTPWTRTHGSWTYVWTYAWSTSTWSYAAHGSRWASTLASVLGSKFSTLRQKPTFYPEIRLILIFQKCEFCEKCDFRNVNFVKNAILETWILWKMFFSKMWILWKLLF